MHTHVNTHYSTIHTVSHSPPPSLPPLPGESYQVEVQYRLHHYGHFPATMYFEFCPDQPGSKSFCILREMEAWARGALGVELGPVEPYRPYQAAIRRPVNTVIVEGERPER